MRLSEFITSNAERVLREWEEFAKKFKGGFSLPRWILRDHGAAIVKLLAQQTQISPLARGQDAKAESEGATGLIEHVTAAHVQLRIESGFDLAQIIGEYLALRACVLRLWQESDPDSFASGAVEIARFSEAIDENVAAGVLYYEERETQYRDRFLGILGHDLRNPINAILLNATVLSGQGLDEKQLATVSRILNSTRRLTGMVDDILDFARGRLGSPMPIRSAPTNLQKAVSEVIDEVQSANPGSSIDFEAKGDLNGFWDIQRLKQMLCNLVRNGLQHGSAKNVKITATGDEYFVILEVHNEGPPIAQELLPIIFDPLVRGANPDPDKASLGLGLFIANEIVSAHNGSIKVTSSERAGTSFVVRLPRRTR
jgi:signal transduction histidine kinase